MEKVQKVKMKKMKEMISLTSLMGYMLIRGFCMCVCVCVCIYYIYIYISMTKDEQHLAFLPVVSYTSPNLSIIQCSTTSSPGTTYFIMSICSRNLYASDVNKTTIPRMHKFSKNLGATSKFLVPKSNMRQVIN